MDISQIPNEVGVLYERAFIDIGIVNRNVEVQILEIKNLIEDSKVERYIRIKYFVYSVSGGSYTVVINKVEAESLITAMDKIISIANNEKKFTYTEIVFRTYEGLIVGSFYKKDEDKWSFYLEKDRSVYSSLYSLKQDKFIYLLLLIRTAFKKL